MKRTWCVLFLVLLTFSALTGALSEETAQYSDRFYSFRYPASWNQGVAYDGTIILEIPGTGSGVMTYAAVSEVFGYTGDPESDAALAESVIAEFTAEKAREKGKNTALSGEYELIQVGDMRGFRAPGTWLSSGSSIVMIQLTCDDHLVSFSLIGGEAIAMEDALLNSVELKPLDETVSSEGFLLWQGDLFEFSYPENFSKLDYGMKDQAEVILLANMADTSNLLMARTYPLDYDYADDYAAIFASSLLPKSTGIDAEAEMLRCGDWNTAVIKGEVDAGFLCNGQRTHGAGCALYRRGSCRVVGGNHGLGGYLLRLNKLRQSKTMLLQRTYPGEASFVFRF